MLVDDGDEMVSRGTQTAQKVHGHLRGLHVDREIDEDDERTGLGRMLFFSDCVRNATNRLLAGPFKDAKAAQGFINQLSAEGIKAFAWSSTAGQKITKLKTP